MSAMVHNQHIGFEEYSRGQRLEQGKDGKAGKKAMDEYLQNGAMTEGTQNMMTPDKLNSFVKNGFQGYGDVDADGTTAKPEFWEAPSASGDGDAPAADSPRAEGRERPACLPRAGAADLDFDPHIECLEQSTKLFSTISAVKINLVRPVEKSQARVSDRKSCTLL